MAKRKVEDKVAFWGEEGQTAPTKKDESKIVIAQDEDEIKILKPRVQPIAYVTYHTDLNGLRSSNYGFDYPQKKPEPVVKGQNGINNAQKDVAIPPIGKNSALKKRGFWLCLSMLLMLIALVATALAELKSFSYSGYCAIYLQGSESIGAIDPFLGLVKSLTALALPSVFYGTYMGDIASLETVSKIFAYAVPVVSGIYVICAFIGFIKALSGLAQSKRGGYYKLHRFGALTIIMFVSALILLIGGILLSGSAFGDIMSLLFPEEGATFGFGYGMILLIVIPVLCFFFGIWSYKKPKKDKTKKKAK